MVNLGIKSAVKEWMAEKWNNWVKKPIEDATEKYENQANQQISTYGNKAKETAYKPIDYYRNQPTFYRGLFWIAVGCLIVLWIISGS